MQTVDIFDKNEQKADALQEKYGLNMVLRDLYAWETLTESEVINLQKFMDVTRPNYTGDFDSDLKLLEAYDKETEAMNLDESMLVDPLSKDLYVRGSLGIREALELQKMRALCS